MEIFKFNNPTETTLMEQGELINGLKDKLWVERFREAGEFKFKGEASLDLMDKLSIGTFVSHVDSHEIMMVEDHEINDSKDQAAELIITGRSFEVFADHRIVGSDQSYPTSGGLTEYVIPAESACIQAYKLLRDHVVAAYLTDTDDAIPHLTVIETVGVSDTVEERVAKRGSLYSNFLEILAIDDCGVRTVRPGPWSYDPSSSNFVIEIFEGEDKSDEIIFSNDTGEVESADYFWSNRKKKNTVYIHGRWVDTLVTTAETGYDRRMMILDASDLDQEYSSAPTGTTRSNIVNKMQKRGQEALAAQKDISLVNAEASENAKNWVYRTDFDVGDIVTVVGNYNEAAPMRITEFVEVEDEYGESGYPTLTPYFE